MRRNTTDTTTQITGSVMRMRRTGLGRWVSGQVSDIKAQLLWALRGDGFDADAGDAAAGHLFDDKAAASVNDALAGDGEMAKLGQQESGEGLDPGLAGEGPAELGVQVAQGGAAVQRH